MPEQPTSVSFALQTQVVLQPMFMLHVQAVHLKMASGLSLNTNSFSSDLFSQPPYSTGTRFHLPCCSTWLMGSLSTTASTLLQHLHLLCRCSLTLHRSVPSRLAKRCMVWHRMAQHSAARHSTAQNSTARRQLALHALVHQA